MSTFSSPTMPCSSASWSCASAFATDMSTHDNEQTFDRQEADFQPGLYSVVQLEVLEAFRHRQALPLPHLGRALLDGFLQLAPIADLALVLFEGIDLQVDGVADVDPDVGLVRAAQIDLLDLMRFQA